MNMRILERFKTNFKCMETILRRLLGSMAILSFLWELSVGMRNRLYGCRLSPNPAIAVTSPRVKGTCASVVIYFQCPPSPSPTLTCKKLCPYPNKKPTPPDHRPFFLFSSFVSSPPLCIPHHQQQWKSLMWNRTGQVWSVWARVSIPIQHSVEWGCLGVGIIYTCIRIHILNMHNFTATIET